MPLSPDDLDRAVERTLAHYEGRAAAFWEGTRDHDVSQNMNALLGHLPGDGPHRILDFGCGPGRDLMRLTELGHVATGLDGTEAFVKMAREHSGCEVFHQSFLELDLRPASFDGVFANASLFHVPLQELPRVLGELRECLRPGGALFASNPRGDNQEGFNGERYGAYHDLQRWQTLVTDAGLELVTHYYRPEGKPREEQPWLASISRRPLR